MSRTVEEQAAWFMQAMGCAEVDLMSAINRQRDDLTMLAMGMLSDAQEALEHDSPGLARQYMNRAKYVMGKQQDRQRYLDKAKPVVPQAELGHVLELAENRVCMWDEYASTDAVQLDEFYECDCYEAEGIATNGKIAVDRVRDWLKEVKS